MLLIYNIYIYIRLRSYFSQISQWFIESKWMTYWFCLSTLKKKRCFCSRRCLPRAISNNISLAIECHNHNHVVTTTQVDRLNSSFDITAENDGGCIILRQDESKQAVGDAKLISTDSVCCRVSRISSAWCRADLARGAMMNESTCSQPDCGQLSTLLCP